MQQMNSVATNKSIKVGLLRIRIQYIRSLFHYPLCLFLIREESYKMIHSVRNVHLARAAASGRFQLSPAVADFVGQRPAGRRQVS